MEDYTNDDPALINSWVTKELLTSKPYNGLTPSDMLVSDQNNSILGINDFYNGPNNATERRSLYAASGPQPIPSDLASSMSPDGRPGVAGTNGRSLTSGFWQPSFLEHQSGPPSIEKPDIPKGWMYDGPPRSDASVTKMLDDLGFPTSVRGLVGDAESALMGITSDLTSTTSQKSVSDIFLSDGRMRGLGSLLIISAVVGITFKSLFGTD